MSNYSDLGWEVGWLKGMDVSHVSHKSPRILMVYWYWNSPSQQFSGWFMFGPSCSRWAKNRKLRCQIQELGTRVDQWLRTRCESFAGESGSLLAFHRKRALGNNKVLVWFTLDSPLGHPSRLAIWTTLPRCIMPDRRCYYTIHIAAYNGNHRSPSTFHVAWFHWITSKPMAPQTNTLPHPQNIIQNSSRHPISCHWT